MSIYQDADREAHHRCSETCGKVYDGISEAIRKVLARSDWLTEESSQDVDSITAILAQEAFDACKTKGTEPLREALIECEGERLEAEEKLSYAKDEIETLRGKAFDLIDERDELRHEVEELRAEVVGLQSAYRD